MDTTTAFRHDRQRTLRIAFHGSPGVEVLTLTGSLDIFTAHRLRNVVWDSLCTQPLLVLDLDGVEFLDPRGIAALVAVRRWAVGRDIEVVLVCAEPHVPKLLGICRLDTVLPVVDRGDLTDRVHTVLAAAAS